MVDYEILKGMIADEKAHYDEVERRRQQAIVRHEPRDVLAHYDSMQNRSMRTLSALYAQRYRRECEQMT